MGGSFGKQRITLGLFNYKLTFWSVHVHSLPHNFDSSEKDKRY